MLEFRKVLETINARRLLQVVVLLMALMLVVFVSAIITLKAMTWGKTVEVPDVRGRELAEVVNLLRETGLEASVEREEHHPAVPANAVIYQDHEPGRAVKKGRSVAVVVSLGSEVVVAPALGGEAFKSAQVLLQQKGLVLGETAWVSAQSPRNTVMAQYPEAGKEMQKGSKVDIVVSNGPRPAAFVTPVLTGRTLMEAETVARRMAIKLISGGKGGVIVSQNPEAGMQITAGSPLYVTLGDK